jgi:hypothetical protein
VTWCKIKCLQENLDPGKLWTKECIGHSRQDDDPQYKVAQCRGHNYKRYDHGNVVQETRKGLTFGKRHWKGPKCNNGIRDQGLRQQLRGNKRIKDLGGKWLLCLRKKRRTTNGIREWSSGQRSHLGSGGTLKKTLYEIFRGKIAKYILGNSSRL